jgi:AcrR family transcriptional regulator
MDRAERRQQILTHARDIFARRGYHEARVDDIVSSAGIARGTFYLYFEDKRAVFEEIIDRVVTRLGMAIIRVDPDDRSRTVGDQVMENLRRIVGTLLDDRATTKILFSDAVGLDPALDRKLNSFYDEVAKLLETSLKDGQALGVVAEGDARVFSHLTIGALKELLYQVVMRGGDYTPERIVDEIFAFLRAGYLRMPSETKARSPHAQSNPKPKRARKSKAR